MTNMFQRQCRPLTAKHAYRHGARPPGRASGRPLPGAHDAAAPGGPGNGTGTTGVASPRPRLSVPPRRPLQVRTNASNLLRYLQSCWGRRFPCPVPKGAKLYMHD